jgi:hypothetical protein
VSGTVKLLVILRIAYIHPYVYLPSKLVDRLALEQWLIQILPINNVKL